MRLWKHGKSSLLCDNRFFWQFRNGKFWTFLYLSYKVLKRVKQENLKIILAGQTRRVFANKLYVCDKDKRRADMIYVIITSYNIPQTAIKTNNKVTTKGQLINTNEFAFCAYLICVSKTKTHACLTRRHVLCTYFGLNIFDLYCTNTFKWFIIQHHQLLPSWYVFKSFKADPCGRVISHNILVFFWCCTLKTTEPATFVFLILVCIEKLQWSVFAVFIFHLQISKIMDV